jgi:hypothetical protein
MASHPQTLKSLAARYWFPLSLLVLLVIFIPGVGLFGLNLGGKEGPVNEWLEKAYQLSYHIPIPWWAGLILLLIPLAILVLYFLKLKRKPLQVPSTFLWRKSIEDLHVNSLLQWLRQNVLLLLQLLALLALIYGIMAFRFHGSTSGGKHYILMIDNSASMSATDVAPNRLEWAKQEALKEIDAATDQDIGMVIVFNSNAEIRQSNTTNRGLLRDAVKKIEPTQRTTHIDEALSLADSWANPIVSTEDVASRPDDVEAGKERTYVPPKGTPIDVHLFSDGRFRNLTEASLAGLNSRLAGNESALGNLNLQFHVAGLAGPENVDNVGLVTFNAIRDDIDATQFQVFVRAMNFRNKPVAAHVRLEMFVNGELHKVYGKRVSLPARKVQADATPAKEDAVAPDQPGENSVNFDVPDVDLRQRVVFHAKLLLDGEPPTPLNDQFPLDDEAWLVINPARKSRVLIVGAPNEALEKFFGAEEVLEAVQVDHLEPKDLAEDAYKKPARNGTYDLVIFDRCAPVREENMPRGNTFFIGYPAPPWKKDQLEAIPNPFITGWMGSHPIVGDLRALYSVGLAQAFRIKKEDLPTRTPLLIEGRQITPERNIDLPLLFTLSRQSYTDLVMTFSLINEEGKWNTDWWLQVSFPLFLRNMLFTLGNLDENAVEESLQPGQIKRIRPDGTFKQIAVVGPDQKEQVLSHEERDTRRDFTFGSTENVGLYRVKWESKIQRQFAINLLDAEESNIEPRQAIQIGNETIAAGQSRGQPRELWKWFALAALIVLMVEWYIYNRRIYV